MVRRGHSAGGGGLSVLKGCCLRRRACAAELVLRIKPFRLDGRSISSVNLPDKLHRGVPMETVVRLGERHFKAATEKARALGQTPEQYIEGLIEFDARSFDEILA